MSKYNYWLNLTKRTSKDRHLISAAHHEYFSDVRVCQKWFLNFKMTWRAFKSDETVCGWWIKVITQSRLVSNSTLGWQKLHFQAPKIVYVFIEWCLETKNGSMSVMTIVNEGNYMRRSANQAHLLRWRILTVHRWCCVFGGIRKSWYTMSSYILMTLYYRGVIPYSIDSLELNVGTKRRNKMLKKWYNLAEFESTFLELSVAFMLPTLRHIAVCQIFLWKYNIRIGWIYVMCSKLA